MNFSLYNRPINTADIKGQIAMLEDLNTQLLVQVALIDDGADHAIKRAEIKLEAILEEREIILAGIRHIASKL
jgi:hypothetical protein